MEVKAKQNARKWTKERLKRHPGLWEVEQEEKEAPCWQGEAAILLRNIQDGWSGWFPVVDIEIIRKEK